MHQSDTVSIIVTTKNEEGSIGLCLESVMNQSYTQRELILVDNNSTDTTVSIAKKFTDAVYTKGPERSAQRNYAAKIAKGKYLLFLDADMQLEQDVITECMQAIQEKGAGGVIIPEKSFGKGFWAKVKTFERSFYVGDPSLEAARFYPKQVFTDIRGFDENITGPEDWDLSERVAKKYTLQRISSMILHDEGSLKLIDLMKKKYYYAKKAHVYLKKNTISTFSPKTLFFLRPAFYRNPKQFLVHPVLTLGLLFLLSAELCAGATGYLFTKRG